MKPKKHLIALVAVSILGACGNAPKPTDSSASPAAGSTSAAPSKVSTEPVTLKFYSDMTPADFQKTIAEPVKAKLPYITLEQLAPGKDNGLDKMIASGNQPDLLLDTAHWRLAEYIRNLNLQYDLSDLVKKYNFDLNKFEPVLVNNVKAYGTKGELFAIPYSRYYHALFYNKDIFDKFGVPYPKDGMTWDDARELAVKVTREDAGVAYHGLDPDWYQRSASQLSLPYVDPKTEQAAVISDAWVKYANVIKSIYQIPGNLTIDKPEIGQGKNLFPKEKTIAMWAFGLNAGVWEMLDAGVKGGLNWDMSSFPTFKEAPGIGPDPEGQILAIGPNSKSKDQAFQVIMYLTSDEFQTRLARSGEPPALKSDSIFQQYAADIPISRGKNLQALLKNKPAEVAKGISLYDRDAAGKAWNTFIDIGTGKKDVNTALRELADNINKQIADAKSK